MTSSPGPCFPDLSCEDLLMLEWNHESSISYNAMAMYGYWLSILMLKFKPVPAMRDMTWLSSPVVHARLIET